jgi:hypothetical protein
MFYHVNGCYVYFLFVLMSGKGTIVPTRANTTSLMHSFQRVWACNYVFFMTMPANVGFFFVLKLGKGTTVARTATVCLFPFQAICIKHRDPA